MTITLIDAQMISDEVDIRLKQANDGHFYIKRTPKRHETSYNYFKVTEQQKERLMKMTTEEAWFEMEKISGASPL